ncbi:MAG: hypothetical protein EOO43_18900, partial [Flavobacterium sp.]
IYTVTFDIFLNQYFRIPAALIGVFIAFAFQSKGKTPMIAARELYLIFIASFLYYAIGFEDFKRLIVNLVIIVPCALYFNLYVADNINRLKVSILLFFSCLLLSTIVMAANHIDPANVNMLRETLIGAPVIQSPSGICVNIFTFGYQVAAFSTFVFIYTLLSNRSFLLNINVLIICLLPVFFGMQRSALVVFVIATVIVTLFYFRMKSIPVLAMAAVFAVILVFTLSNTSNFAQDNILKKEQENSQLGENRSGLVTENLKIYTDYPLGLLFYNKSWPEVSKNNPTFQGGLTSHNAYLMFITYLGPFVGLLLLFSIYYRFGSILKTVLLNIRNRDKSLMAALCFAFIAVSLNSLFHNAWLISANGPTIFLFFCILQLNYIDSQKNLQ